MIKPIFSDTRAWASSSLPFCVICLPSLPYTFVKPLSSSILRWYLTVLSVSSTPCTFNFLDISLEPSMVSECLSRTFKIASIVLVMLCISSESMFLFLILIIYSEFCSNGCHYPTRRLCHNCHSEAQAEESQSYT